MDFNSKTVKKIIWKEMFDVKAYIASLGNPAEIIHLDLSNKNITHLDEDTFENLTRLRRLCLSKNQLTFLPPCIFQYNTQLKELFLCFNWLTFLPSNLFQYNNQLEILDLGKNQLTTLPPKVFENLTQLKRLILHSQRNITSLPDSLFQHNNKLRMLYLQGNQLTSIPPVNEFCWTIGREEIEERRKDKEEHWKKWKFVNATLESLPPCPSNYVHLPVFTKTFLGRVGGVDWVRGLEEFEILSENNLSS